MVLRGDFEQFREHQRRVYRWGWIAVIAISVGGFFALGVAWSYVAGVVWAVVLPLISYEALKRWNRHQWIRHFPGLAAGEFNWIPNSGGPAPSDRSNVMKTKRS